MSDTLSKIAARIGDLKAGEALVAACRVMPEGAAGEFLFRSTRGRGGVLGRVVSQQVQEKVLGDLPEREQQAAATVGFPLAPEFLLALTDRRLLVCSLSKLTNRVTGVLGVVPFEDLIGADRGEGRLATAQVPKLTLRFRGGEQLGLLTARPHREQLDALAAGIADRLTEQQQA